MRKRKRERERKRERKRNRKREGVKGNHALGKLWFIDDIKMFVILRQHDYKFFSTFMYIAGICISTNSNDYVF